MTVKDFVSSCPPCPAMLVSDCRLSEASSR